MDEFQFAEGSKIGITEKEPWQLIERWCDRYPHDWRLVFKRGSEILEINVSEEIWRAFDGVKI